MTEHRLLQRALVRMQLDASFAREVLSGDDAALRSTGLEHEDLALLRALDPRAVAADRGGRRRTQILGNAASEYALTLALAERFGAAPGLLDGFARSRELHEALRTDGRLPLAFGEYALRRAGEAHAAPLAPLAALEAGLVRARRAEAPPIALAPGELVRAPRAHLLELPQGTLALAEHLRAALDAEREPQLPARVGPARETALLLAAERAHAHQLPDVRVERLEPAVAALLALAERPLDAAARARIARELGAELDELESFADALVADGVLMRGGAPS